jgi:hypothetical protein
MPSSITLAKRNAAGGGKIGGAYVNVPSLMAIHSKSPILKGKLSVFIVIFHTVMIRLDYINNY